MAGVVNVCPCCGVRCYDMDPCIACGLSGAEVAQGAAKVAQGAAKVAQGAAKVAQGAAEPKLQGLANKPRRLPAKDPTCRANGWTEKDRKEAEAQWKDAYEEAQNLRRRSRTLCSKLERGELVSARALAGELVQSAEVAKILLGWVDDFYSKWPCMGLTLVGKVKTRTEYGTDSGPPLAENVADDEMDVLAHFDDEP